MLIRSIRSVNIGHLEAVVHILEQPFVTGVSRVCKRVSTGSSCSSSGVVHVDIVCTLNKKPVWIIVSDRNPSYVYWQGYRRDKGLKLRIEQVMDAASRSTKTMTPRSIVLFFPRGVGESIREKLEDEFGAFKLELGTRSYREAASVLEIKLDNDEYPVTGASRLDDHHHLQGLGGEIKLNSNDPFRSLVSGMKTWSTMDSSNPGALNAIDDELLNFSTTSLIAIVSGISNGCAEKLLSGPECQLREQFKGNTEFVKSEIQNPLLPELVKIVSGKRGIVCRTVVSEFEELVSMFAGANEKSRARDLLKRLLVVEDTPSERMTSLPTTRKLDSKSKIMFGTGDYWRAPTLTANMAFVRAVSQTGMSLVTIGHRPRALIGD
ncbi:UPF0415 protein C7orf25 homolog [Linum perenne]